MARPRTDKVGLPFHIVSIQSPYRTQLTNSFINTAIRFSDFLVNEITEDGEILHLHNFHTNPRAYARDVCLSSPSVVDTVLTWFVGRIQPCKPEVHPESCC